MGKRKRGQIWVSAALYTALGVILVTLILSVGMPFVNKLKARNTVLQTKNVLYDLDNVIRTVNNEGFGSKRPVFVDIGEGNFEIKDRDAVGKRNRIEWTFVSEEKLGIEPDLGKPIEEGNLKIESKSLGQGYEIKLYLDYEESIELESNLKVLSGKYNLVVEHKLSDAGEDYIYLKG